MVIGIPRSLIYWKQPFFWEAFFKELGFEVLLSPATNKEIVEMGVKAADPETCFSNKVYWGHLLWLQEKCNLIFVPRLKTNELKLEYCPKLFGLPDLAKILTKTPILTETFDEKKEKFEKTLERLGGQLDRKKEEVRKAAEIAFLKEKELREKEKEEFFKKIQSPERSEGREMNEVQRSKKKKIVLVSHPYNLYDDFVNLRIKEKLEKLGAESIFIDEVPNPKSPAFAKTSADKQIPNPGWPKFHWEFGREIMEKISEVLDYDITAAIEISSFGCGCDAVLKEFVERTFKENKIPFLYLMIDEQTGEAGFQTRLEAFIDTLK